MVLSTSKSTNLNEKKTISEPSTNAKQTGNTKTNG